MAELIKKEREFVIPGEEIIKSMDYLPGRNCYREGEFILSKKIGLVSVSGRVISVIALNGIYVPKVDDMVIGVVEDIQGTSGWIIDIKSPCRAFLPLSGVREFVDTSRTSLNKIYDIGDVLYANIHMVAQQSDSVHISMQDPRARKMRGGRVLSINPAKVPRIIGKQGSMISMIKDATGSRISIGQNGFMWFEGGNEELVLKAINMIDREAYTTGLTDRVAELLGRPKPERPQEGERRDDMPAAEEPYREEQFKEETSYDEAY